MTLINNACIQFDKPIPPDALLKLKRIDDDFQFSATFLEFEEVYGDITDDLNEVVEILKPYGVSPVVGEYNRYFGDYDGYDVFTGERFESMDDEDYGGWLVRREQGKYDAVISAARDLVEYFSLHNGNCTKSQHTKIGNLRNALDFLGSI